jgi:hypothetical protein
MDAIRAKYGSKSLLRAKSYTSGGTTIERAGKIGGHKRMKDRGSKKWVSLYLPEHKKMLLDLHEEQKWVTQPVLDEQRIEELSQVISDAYLDALNVAITYHENHARVCMKGQITKVD